MTSLLKLTGRTCLLKQSTVWRGAIASKRTCSINSSRYYSTSLDPPKSFSNQSKVPRLPIPTLQETTERYKKSLIPLLTSEELEKANNAVDEFMKKGGLGETLQQRLKDLDAAEPYSWLEDIWLAKAYLEWRDPTLLNVNWWSQFKDPDAGILKQAPPAGDVSDIQITRAASLISGLVTFSDKINEELVPPESTRAGPLCMNQYKKQFGASRIADSPGDRIITPWPATATHITVIFKDQYFHVEVKGKDGTRVPVKAIKCQLQDVVAQVNSLSELQPPVGVLTSEHRDTWAKVRKSLESNSLNAETLKSIDMSLFAICLDDYASDLDLDISHRNFFHGRNARNRWFDKAMQFVVENNGRAGVNGEHSPADAVIPGNIFVEILSNEPIPDPENVSLSATLPKPKRLQWHITSDVADAITLAEKNAKKMIENMDSVVLHYEDYGSEFLKKIKVSPDAYIQMAYQLAYYRQHGTSVPTYESASTRAFLHGRTETVRSCSVDSVRFTKGWEDKSLSKQRKFELFDTAVNTHLEYMKAASNGKGVDRHLLGLRVMLRPEETPKATLFQDPSYVKSMYFKLSTSNTSPGNFHWGGFGAVVPEGYGINYSIGQQRVRMSVSSWKNYKETDSSSFRSTIKNVLDELAEAFSTRQQ